MKDEVVAVVPVTKTKVKASSLFVSPDETHNKTIIVGRSNDGSLVTYIDGSEKERAKQIVGDTVKIEICIKKINFRQRGDFFNKIFASEDSASTDSATKPMGLPEIQIKKILSTVKSWDITDDDGSELPVTEEALSKLPPEITVAIYKATEKINP